MRISDWSSDVCSSDLYRCSHHHTRRGDRAQSLRQPRSMLMPGVSARSSRIHMPCHATDSQHNAHLLDGVVRVAKHHADHPDLGAQRMSHHFHNPTHGDTPSVDVLHADDPTPHMPAT